MNGKLNKPGKQATNITFIFPLVLGLVATIPTCVAISGHSAPAPPASIRLLVPPEDDFFSKELFCNGIPIKSHQVVSDQALYLAYTRLQMMLAHLPTVTSNIVGAKVELHIIGKDQVTTDLPEWRQDKGKPLPEYNGLTRDQRTRGMGGQLTSCGEENLLQLKKDRYFGRDICVHEFSHVIRDYGMDEKTVARFDGQYRKSLQAGLWVNSYAGANPDEFFAELSMWYFGTHGDLNMKGAKPDNGPEGLRQYDRDAYQLFDDFYRGRIPVNQKTFTTDHNH